MLYRFSTVLMTESITEEKRRKQKENKPPHKPKQASKKNSKQNKSPQFRYVGNKVTKDVSWNLVICTCICIYRFWPYVKLLCLFCAFLFLFFNWQAKHLIGQKWLVPLALSCSIRWTKKKQKHEYNNTSEFLIFYGCVILDAYMCQH